MKDRVPTQKLSLGYWKCYYAHIRWLFKLEEDNSATKPPKNEQKSCLLQIVLNPFFDWFVENPISRFRSEHYCYVLHFAKSLDKKMTKPKAIKYFGIKFLCHPTYLLYYTRVSGKMEKKIKTRKIVDT